MLVPLSPSLYSPCPGMAFPSFILQSPAWMPPPVSSSCHSSSPPRHQGGSVCPSLQHFISLSDGTFITVYMDRLVGRFLLSPLAPELHRDDWEKSLRAETLGSVPCQPCDLEHQFSNLQNRNNGTYSVCWWWGLNNMYVKHFAQCLWCILHHFIK